MASLNDIATYSLWSGSNDDEYVYFPIWLALVIFFLLVITFIIGILIGSAFMHCCNKKDDDDIFLME